MGRAGGHEAEAEAGRKSEIFTKYRDHSAMCIELQKLGGRNDGGLFSIFVKTKYIKNVIEALLGRELNCRSSRRKSREGILINEIKTENEKIRIRREAIALGMRHLLPPHPIPRLLINNTNTYTCSSSSSSIVGAELVILVYNRLGMCRNGRGRVGNSPNL